MDQTRGRSHVLPNQWELPIVSRNGKVRSSTSILIAPRGIIVGHWEDDIDFADPKTEPG